MIIRKMLYIICLCLLNLGVSFSQNIEAPKISTSKLKWTKQIQSPNSRIFDPTISQVGDTQDTVPRRIDIFPPGGLPILYIYQATFKNETDKKIKGLVWDYVFEDIETNQELNRHQFHSFNSISRGKSETIKGKLESPPTNVVSAKSLEKNSRSPYRERIEIKCVVYTDNTTWKDLKTDERVCEELRKIIRWQERIR